MDCHKKSYCIISQKPNWMQSVPDNQGKANAHGVLNRARLFYTVTAGHHDKVPTILMASQIKGLTTYTRRHAAGKSCRKRDIDIAM